MDTGFEVTWRFTVLSIQLLVVLVVALWWGNRVGWLVHFGFVDWFGSLSKLPIDFLTWGGGFAHAFRNYLLLYPPHPKCGVLLFLRHLHPHHPPHHHRLSPCITSLSSLSSLVIIIIIIFISCSPHLKCGVPIPHILSVGFLFFLGTPPPPTFTLTSPPFPVGSTK